MVYGLGLRVDSRSGSLGLDLRIEGSGLGFRGWYLGFRGVVLGFMVYGLWWRSQGSGIRVSGVRFCLLRVNQGFGGLKFTWIG